MENTKNSFSSWKKLFEKEKRNSKKSSRNERITRHDLIMLNYKLEQLEMGNALSTKSSNETSSNETSSQLTGCYSQYSGSSSTES